MHGLKPELRRHWGSKENIMSVNYYRCMLVNIDHNNLIDTAKQYIINTHFTNSMFASLYIQYNVQCKNNMILFLYLHKQNNEVVTIVIARSY
jgi:hypothetical protein